MAKSDITVVNVSEVLPCTILSRGLRLELATPLDPFDKVKSNKPKTTKEQLTDLKPEHHSLFNYLFC